MKNTVLITGGTGFLGKRLAIALRETHHVILGARNNKLNQAAAAFTGCEVVPLDVARPESIRDALVAAKPHTIIHAAATKFVDLAEKQPLECIDVNVTGSVNLARAALDYGVASVIGISTDKAAPPVRNTYGLSKALMERAFCSLDRRNGGHCHGVHIGRTGFREQNKIGVEHVQRSGMRDCRTGLAGSGVGAGGSCNAWRARPSMVIRSTNAAREVPEPICMVAHRVPAATRSLAAFADKVRTTPLPSFRS